MIDTISIMSCYREPSYLNSTIESIPSNFDIELFYQGNSNEVNIDNIKIYEIKHIADLELVYPNSQFNYASILLRSKCGLIVEDDVYFSQNFSKYLSILEELLITRGFDANSSYVIALYSCYDWGSENVDLIEYPVESFYATQAMIYSKKTAKEFGHFLMGRIGLEPYDLALKSFIHKNPETKLMASTRSLVQHTGAQTSGLGFFHQTSNFIN